MQMVKDKHNIQCLCSLFFVLISKSNWRIIVSIWVDKCNVCLLKKEGEEEGMASLSSCWCWLKRVRPLSSLLYNDSMIYLGHYSSLLVLPFSSLLFVFFFYPIRREKVSFFFLLLFFFFFFFFHPLAMLTRYSNKNVKHGVSFEC